MKRPSRRPLRQGGPPGVRGERTVGRRNGALVLGPDTPPVAVMEVVDRDADGELLVRLVKGASDAIVPLEPFRGEGAPGVGDRVLARLERLDDGVWRARLIKRLGQSARRVLGVIRKSRGEIRVEPVDRRNKDAFVLAPSDGSRLADGDLVLVEAIGGGERRYGPKRSTLLEVVGREDHPRAASLIAIHTHALPVGFSEAAEAEAAGASAPSLEGLSDLRHLPFVTIDPEDARDHDDAVFAEFTSVHEPFVVWVAIADVARYVRAGGDLDREAWTKANSVYFPDRVEPMLPERLSADLCSLRQGEERAVLAVRMSFAADGRKTGHVFRRALIRSRAKLSYHQAQAGFDGRIDAAADPWRETVLEPLQAAYRGLARARERRGPLDIDSPERRIELNGDGEVVSVAKRERLEAHRLIEEMMIQANVCAAETLEQKKSAFIYRIHEAPSEIKLAALADFLETVGLSWSRGEPPRTDRFNRLLQTCAGGVHQDIVNEVVLRTQMQARYSPENFGHFGLNLSRYAHFTSPIRRYADLVVHRALIRALDLGADGLSDADAARLEATADHITAAERTAMAAERDAVDRYMAAFLQDRVGATFAGRITGVTRFGLFVRLEETGADGLVPIGSLGPEYLQHDERLHALVGERTGAAWRLGAAVEVRLKEAAPVTGGLLFEMLSDPQAAEPGAARRTSRSGSLKGQSKGPPRRLRRGR